MASTAQRSFSSGELAPALHARTDVSKYATGLKTCRNFVVLPSGGVSNRAGTEFVAAVKNSANPTRLLKFVYNTDQTYVLEFGDRYMRVLHGGAPVVVTGVPAWDATVTYAVGALVAQGGVNYYCRIANTGRQPADPDYWFALTGGIYEIPTPYAAADLDGLQFVQSADVVTIVHPNYAPTNLARTGHTAWTLTGITFGAKISPPAGVSLLVHGGATSTVYWWAVTSVSNDTGEESLPRAFNNGLSEQPTSTTPVTIAWPPVAGASSYNIYRSTDGVVFGFVGTSSPAQLGQSVVTNTNWTTATATVTGTVAGTAQSSGQARITAVSGSSNKAANGAYTIKGLISLQLFSGNPPSTVGRARAFYSRDGEPRIDAGIVGSLTLLQNQGDSLLNVPFQGTIAVPDNGYTQLVIDVVAEVVTVTGDDAACALDFTTAPNNVVFQTVNTGQVTFVDKGPDPDFSISPPVPRIPFNAIGHFPSAIGYYQQRRVYGNTAAEPEKVWTSRSGAYDNFTVSSPVQDDDAVTFTLAGREVNAIRHLIDLNKLLIFTTGGVTTVEGDGNGVLTPTAVNARQRSYAGASAVRPVVTGNRVLYIDARAPILRELTNDEVQGVGSADLTVFSSHLFQGYSLVDLDLQVNPFPVIWAVRSDGVMLGLTYLPEQQVWGWHRHDTDGAVERVCVVPEGTEDAVYLVVRRTINGTDRRYIERLASRQFSDITKACFLDASLVYDGANPNPTSTASEDQVILTGGTNWTPDETLTIYTYHDGFFTTDNVSDAIVLTAADGSTVRCDITAYVSGNEVRVRASRTIPLDLRAPSTVTGGTAAWTRAVRRVSGLDHLEGKAVGVFADGAVAANPNDGQSTTVVVVGGAITLDQPYAYIRVGLPIVADLETLDIDTPQGGSLKASAMHIGRVGLMLERSRGGFAGRRFPAGNDVFGLNELKQRRIDDDYNTMGLVTGYADVIVAGGWDSNGRIVVRQIDPLPLTVLAAIPQGAIPGGA